MRELWLHVRDGLAIIGALWVLLLVALLTICVALSWRAKPYRDEMQEGGR